MVKFILKMNEEHRARLGHQWIFSNEVYKVEGDIQNGDLVKVYDSNAKFIGCGFCNINSLIAVRLISASEEVDLEKLFNERLINAFKFRKLIYPLRNSFRMVFSESDFLPGLIIDKYNDTYVMQIYSAGMEKNIEFIVSSLKNEFNAKNIITKHESYFRILEGLPLEDKIYLGEMSDEIISDGKINYKINFASGQKTGFYFDQCDNREFAGKFCKDKSVLDCFCNSGGFGLHASLNGAQSVTYVDASRQEIENAKSNVILNGLTCKTEFIEANAFDYMENAVIENQLYDVVIIDPPAFAKRKKNIEAAVKGYGKLNRLAMSIIKHGGFLFTSSCSYHLNEEMFLEILSKSASKAGKRIQLIHFNYASMDHPSLPIMRETKYLKFAALRIY